MIDKKLKGYILAAPYGDMEVVDNDCLYVVERKIQRLRAGPVGEMIGAIDL